MDLFPGCDSFEAIRDLWWHDLLGEQWAPLIKNIEIHPYPLEYITPGTSGPRHELRGLAVFTISAGMVRQRPTIVFPEAPLATFD